MKRRPSRRSSDRAASPLHSAFAAAVARTTEGYLDDGGNDSADAFAAPADLTRRAIATVFELATRILEGRDDGPPAGRIADDLTIALAEVDDRAIDADVLGDVLSWLATTPIEGLDSRLRDAEPRRVRTAGGSFFTPLSLVERTLDATLEPSLDETTASKNPPEAEAALLRLAILDPSCGSGRFLFAAADRIARRLAQVRSAVRATPWRSADAAAFDAARCDVIERCLFGVDVDPVAVELVRFRMRRAAVKAGLEASSSECDVLQSDALLEVDWRTAFDGRRFDLAVGNPPWTSFSGRHRGDADPAYIARLIERYPCLARWPSLHGATVDLASRIVRPGGRVGFVLPLRVADLDAYSPLREQATRRLRLSAPVEDVGEAAFANVRQPAGIFVFVADATEDDRSSSRWSVVRSTDPRSASSASSAKRSTAEDALVDDLLDRLARCARFPAKTFGDPGVHTGNAAKKLILAEALPEVASAPVREGRDVAAFACRDPRKLLGLDVAVADGEYFRIRPLERYLQTPILVRQTADRPIAARHVERTYFRNSLLACRGVEGLPDVVVVALLNSALFAGLHRRLAADAAQRTFPQVKVRALQTLPCPSLAVLGRSEEGRSLSDRLVEAATMAEEQAESGRAPDADLLERIERLVLHAFELPEDLAPALLAAACAHRLRQSSDQAGSCR